MGEWYTPHKLYPLHFFDWALFICFPYFSAYMYFALYYSAYRPFYTVIIYLYKNKRKVLLNCAPNYLATVG